MTHNAISNELLPNSPESLSPKIVSGEIPRQRIGLMLLIRSLFSFGLLLLLAIVFLLTGHETPLSDSAAYWLWFITMTNVLCIILLNKFAKQEGLRLRDIFNFQPSTWKKDLLCLLIALVGIGVFGFFPATWLGNLLWGNANLPNAILMQPLPLLAIYPLFLLMPTTQALAELPIYWGYVAPRLRASGMKPWVVILVVGFVLSLQHVFFSFQWDWRYLLWLAVKYLPFAIWTGFLVDRRPTLLPYLMGVHFLMDASLPVLILLVSTGKLSML